MFVRSHAIPYITTQSKGRRWPYGHRAARGATFFQSFIHKLIVKVNLVSRHTDLSQELWFWMSFYIYTNCTRLWKCPTVQLKQCNLPSVERGLWPPVFSNTRLSVDGAVVLVNFPRGPLTHDFWIFLPPWLYCELSLVPLITKAYNWTISLSNISCNCLCNVLILQRWTLENHLYQYKLGLNN